MNKDNERSLQCKSCNEVFSLNELELYRQELLVDDTYCPCCEGLSGFKSVHNTYEDNDYNRNNIKQYVGKLTSRKVVR